MGFENTKALDAAQKFPDNIEEAMYWIANKEAIDKILNEEDKNKQNNIKPPDEAMDFENQIQKNENEQPIIDNQHSDNYSDDEDDNDAIIQHHENADNILKELQTANKFIKGEYDPDTNIESMLILSDMIGAVLTDNKNDKYSNDTIESFITWTNKVKAITLNSFYYQDICNLYLTGNHKRVKNLFAFDKINEVFKNVEVITAHHTGYCSLYYLELLLHVLDNINCLEYSKLHKIHLNDINNIGSLSDFEKYQAIFRQKTWNIEKGVSNIIVSRYY